MLKGTSVHFEKIKDASPADPDWKRFTLAPHTKIVNKFQVSLVVYFGKSWLIDVPFRLRTAWYISLMGLLRLEDSP